MHDETYIKMNTNCEHAIDQQNYKHYYGIKINSTNIRSAKRTQLVINNIDNIKEDMQKLKKN